VKLPKPAAHEEEEREFEKGSRKPNPVDIHVGGRVRFRRMLLGMSQEKLGERLGLTFQQVQKYEKGINRIGASRLFDLSHVLGVPVQFFYDEAPAAYEHTPSREVGFAERQTESYITEFLNTRDGLELNKAFVKITDGRQRRAIVDLVRSLAGEDLSK
jgi:transcriptional regulator with XRE-family HTH domain